MGDLACCLPAATAIRQHDPDAEIVWLADRRFAGLAECCPAIDQVVTLPKSLGEIRSTIRNLGEFDVAFDLQGLLKSALPVGLAKAKLKLGYHWQREAAWLFSSPVTPDPSSIHIVDQYMDVIRAAGIPVDKAPLGLTPHPEDLASVQAVLTGAGWEGRAPLVVMNAGAGWKTKRWDPAHFAFVSRGLIDAGAAIALLGTEADRPVFAEVLACEPGAVMDLLGKTSVRALPALLSIASVHIGGDTGSTHIAALLERPCIGVYTLTRPQRSCPYGQLENCLSLDPAEVLARARTMAGLHA